MGNPARESSWIYIEIVLICAVVWVVFTACVLALLKAAKVADEAVDDNHDPLPTPAHFDWRPAPLARHGRRPAAHGR